MGTNRVNSDLPNVGKMNINFKLLKVSQFENYISPVMEKPETSNLDSR